MFGIFLDSETSGLDPRDHKILEIAFQICDLGSMHEVARYSSYVKVSDEDWKRTISISDGNVRPRIRKLSKAEINLLIENGKTATNKFFKQ